MSTLVTSGADVPGSHASGAAGASHSGAPGPAGAQPDRRIPHLVGHRGAAALVPENTLASFRRGVKAGADRLECDVHLSADGQDVIIHDGTIDRTAQPDSPRRTGAVKDLTRAQLDDVLVGDGECPPRLREVLEAAVRDDGSRVPVSVEIKAVEAAELVADILVDTFTPQDFADPATAPVWVLSFHADALRIVKERAGHLPLFLTIDEPTEAFWQTAQELGVTTVGLRIATARIADLEKARSLGMLVDLWTARSDEELERAVELGADTIAVDDPEWARERLRELIPGHEVNS